MVRSAERIRSDRMRIAVCPNLIPRSSPAGPGIIWPRASIMHMAANDANGGRNGGRPAGRGAGRQWQAQRLSARVASWLHWLSC